MALLPVAPAAADTASAREIWQEAVALVQADAPRAAIPLLERLVTAAPDAAAVRLELGLAYYLVEEDDKARYHFTRALAADLEDRERAAAEALLRRIEARQRWSAAFGLAIVPQSNAGRRTSQETVIIGGLPFRLTQTARPGTGVAPSVRLGYEAPLQGDLWGRGALSFGGTLYKRSALNDYSLRGELGLSRRADRGREIGAGVLATQRWVGNRRYWHEVGLYASGGMRSGPATRLVFRTEGVERRARGRPALDASVGRLVVGAERVLSPRLAVFGRSYATLTDAASARESGLLIGASLGVTRLFPGGWRTTLEGSLSRDRRDGPDPLFGITRRDTDLRLTARILNRQLQLRGTAPVLEIGHERRRSNIPIGGFTNTYVSLGLERAF